MENNNIANVLPCKDDIKTFFHVVFSGCSGLIPCRSFAEKATQGTKPPRNIWIEADDDMAINAVEFANLAAKAKTAFYVISGTVAKQGEAGSGHILQMQTLLIDIDNGDTESKLAVLSDALGRPTLIVESGGITQEGSSKLHVYWQLVKAVSGDDLKKLLELRHQIALSVGGDTHFKSAHQPIRVAGSIYHKGGAHKLVKIRRYEPVEYELQELVDGAGRLPHNKSDKGDVLLHTIPLKSVITSKVYEGAEGEATRFNHLQRVIGFWLRRLHDGEITESKALEEITIYNHTNVIPPWPDDRLQEMISGLWQKHIKENGKPKGIGNITTIDSFALDAFLTDNTPMPEDIIAPRILTPSGLFVFGGAPKVGKSDFLLSLFVHLAAGEEFVGFKPPRPLRIFYFQAEIGYHYLRERLQNMNLSADLIAKAKDNLFITPNTKLPLNEAGINIVARHVSTVFADKPDIMAVDPIRNVFDGGRDGSTENENDAMLFFLQKRIEPLRDMINPEAGIVLVHHTKKLSNKQFDEEPFAAFSGASSLRGYYTSGGLLRKSEVNSAERELIFELRNGSDIPIKILSKKNGKWIEENPLNRPIVNANKAVKLDAERDRRDQLILDILIGEAAKGHAYTVGAFCEAFEGVPLGSKKSIRGRISILMTKGYIKLFKDFENYGLKKCTSKYGLMCFEGMELVTGDGEVQKVLPTHYKHHDTDDVFPVENRHNWIIYEEKRYV